MVPERLGKRRDSAAAVANGWATTGHDAELWSLPDPLRGSMDAAAYKHVVLRLIFLKHISDAFPRSSASQSLQAGPLDSALATMKSASDPGGRRWNGSTSSSRSGEPFSRSLIEADLGDLNGRAARAVPLLDADSAWLWT